jgi:hypothetical protein
VFHEKAALFSKGGFFFADIMRNGTVSKMNVISVLEVSGGTDGQP